MTVVVLAIILTSPQLYFAWTVSVSEVRAAALQTQTRDAQKLENQYVKPTVNIEPTKARP
jgi:hypothetical protein